MKVTRIEIGLKKGVPDARGQALAAKAERYLSMKLTACQTRDIYKITHDLSSEQIDDVCGAFSDPVIQQAAVNRLSPPDHFDWMIEVGFKPGVTDNVGRTAESILADTMGAPAAQNERVYTGSQYFISGEKLTRDDLIHLGREVIANPLIQTVTVYSADEWREAVADLKAPVFEETTPPAVKTYDLSGSDEDLMRISRDGILSLSLEEMRAIRSYFLREDIKSKRRDCGLPPDPTDVELECIAQTWSEHCFHKIFAGEIHYIDENGNEEHIDSLFKTYIKASTRKIAEKIDWLVSVFSDNAGIIKFDDHLNLAYKVETHNSPSALDPYGGAITGILGVNRDPMGTGMGCSLLTNVWGYCLGSPFYDGELPEGLMHPRRIRDGVHEGVIDGGNQSGIPWSRGFEVFDSRYIGKPLVYCGTLGVTPAAVGERPSERKEIQDGDYLMMCGGRIGKDGIHGATFSSEELRQESPAQAVQIGDAFTQRKLCEFIIEARDLGLFRCITDNGAGGLSCSAGEMGTYSNGVEVELSNAPLKYEGLQPWEILLSEAQERMTLAVAPECVDTFLDLARRRDVEAAVLGTFRNTGEYRIYYEGKIVGCLEMDFLYESGCPKMKMEARWSPPVLAAPDIQESDDAAAVLRRMVGRLNCCSKEYKSRIYDGEVKGLSVLKPYVGIRCNVPSDATVMRVQYGTHRGVALSEGINPFYSDIDTYDMTASVLDEAVRRIISVGGSMKQIAGLDNFCWPDPVVSDKTPDGKYKLAQLVRSNKALYDYTIAYGVPLISGKDSMKNDSIRGGRKISIPPTLLFSALGVIDDVRRIISMDFKNNGDSIYVLGRTRQELGASEYYRMLAEDQGTPDRIGDSVPRVRTDEALHLYQCMERATAEKLLQSSHTPTRGGIGMAVVIAAIGGGTGAEIDPSLIPTEKNMPINDMLFSESNSRFIVTCAPGKEKALKECFAGIPCSRIGTVTADKTLCIKGSQSLNMEELSDTFTKTLWGV